MAIPFILISLQFLCKYARTNCTSIMIKHVGGSKERVVFSFISHNGCLADSVRENMENFSDSPYITNGINGFHN